MIKVKSELSFGKNLASYPPMLIILSLLFFLKSQFNGPIMCAFFGFPERDKSSKWSLPVARIY